MDLSGTITATGQVVTLAPEVVADSGDAVDVGGSDGTNTLGLTDAELDRVTAGTIRIGAATATGGITVSADVGPANSTVLRLQGDGGSVTSTAGGVAVASLAIVAGGNS